VSAESDAIIDQYLAEKAAEHAKKGVKMTRSDAVDRLLRTAQGRRGALRNDNAANRKKRDKRRKKEARG
jgi:hypothetical protein